MHVSLTVKEAREKGVLLDITDVLGWDPYALAEFSIDDSEELTLSVAQARKVGLSRLFDDE